MADITGSQVLGHLHFDEASEAVWAAARAKTAAMVARLEARYAARGLRFTQPFAGAVPVQAYGHLDGMRFYFRFRGNHGSLRVGPYDLEIEQLQQRRNQESRDRKLAELHEKLAVGEVDVDDMRFLSLTRPVELELEDDPRCMPSRTVKEAGIDGEDPTDIYRGDLDDNEAEAMFVTLLERLEDVPASEQLPEHTRIWLYEGIDAADAYWHRIVAQPMTVEDDKHV